MHTAVCRDQSNYVPIAFQDILYCMFKVFININLSNLDQFSKKHTYVIAIVLELV